MLTFFTKERVLATIPPLHFLQKGRGHLQCQHLIPALNAWATRV